MNSQSGKITDLFIERFIHCTCPLIWVDGYIANFCCCPKMLGVEIERKKPVIGENAELGELLVAVSAGVPVRQTVRVPPVAVVVVFSLKSSSSVKYQYNKFSRLKFINEN